jgi:hypothetical protein
MLRKQTIRLITLFTGLLDATTNRALTMLMAANR